MIKLIQILVMLAIPCQTLAGILWQDPRKQQSWRFGITWRSHSVNETIKNHGSCLLLIGIQWKFNEVHIKVTRMIM